MTVVGVIPARDQSSRFPGKPLADICGKPMIQHVYQRAHQASTMQRLLVATDDSRIFDTVQGFGGVALLTGGHHASGTDRIAEACRLLQLEPNDLVVNVQGDEPLLEPSMIDLLVDALQTAPNMPMATLACVSSDRHAYVNPNVVKVVVDRNWRALYFSRSPIPHRRKTPSDTTMSFLRHLGFYAYRHEFLQKFTELPPSPLEELEKLEQLRALENGYSIKVAISPFETQGVDTPEDLQSILATWNTRS